MNISLWVCKEQKKAESGNCPKRTRLNKPCQIAHRRQQSHQRRTSPQGEPDPHLAISACRLPSETRVKAAFEPWTAKQWKWWVNRNISGAWWGCRTGQVEQLDGYCSYWLVMLHTPLNCEVKCPFPKAQRQPYGVPSPLPVSNLALQYISQLY